VLVRTCSKAPTSWSPQFSAFAPETIAWLASLGVRLVGIDAQSVDPADSKTLDSHLQLLAHDLRVLENLVLDEVDAGDYELIALPLKLTEACASPVRAVLRSL
jgi:arylformamidase